MLILWFQLLAFALSLWLGLYVFRRGQQFQPARLAGIALILYAFIIAMQLVWQLAETPPAEFTLRLVWPIWLFTSVFWIGAIEHLPFQHQPYDWAKLWRKGLVPFSLFFAGLTVGTDFIIDFANQGRGPYYAVYAAFHIVLILSSFLAVVIEYWHQRQRVFGWLIIAAVGLACSALLLFYPLGQLAPLWVWPAIAGDMIILGVVIAALDAFETGTKFLPELLRAFVQTFGVIALIVIQVIVITLVWQDVPQIAFPTLLALITTVIVLFQFSDVLQSTLDRLLYPVSDVDRTQLRALEAAVARKSISSLPADDFEQFAKIVRRALSDLNNLPRLAASPLLDLPQLGGTSPLEKAQALRDELQQRIQNLKPNTTDTFDQNTAWRHYNVLYYPYVVGLKPHSRRGIAPETEADYQAVLAWFRADVPERTLYNWQTTAARVLAQDLWDSYKA